MMIDDYLVAMMVCLPPRKTQPWVLSRSRSKSHHLTVNHTGFATAIDLRDSKTIWTMRVMALLYLDSFRASSCVVLGKLAKSFSPATQDNKNSRVMVCVCVCACIVL